MRLTLRTMLAYLDDILEPDDRADLGKKIEDSEFATNLVHRIRDVTQRLRLGAPKLTGRGMGLDPNTVAEYLDNTLSAERVPDFEKVCLESDVHLAEVAAAHQVLALVLGEPAEVDPALRRRMYSLAPGEIVGADLSHTPAGGAKLTPPVIQPATREKPEIPDYLREAKGIRWWSVAAVLLFAALIGAGVVAAIGPDKVANYLGWGQGNQVVAMNDKDKDKNKGLPGGVEQPVPPIEDVAPPVPGDGGLPPVPGDPAPPIPPLPVDKVPVPDKLPIEPLAVPLTPPLPAEVPSKPPVPDVVDIKPLPHPQGEGIVPPLPVPVPIPERPPVEFVPVGGAAGIFVSDEDVLMKWNAKGFWERVAARGAIGFGDALLAFPTYRPTINLNFGVTMQLGGETFAQVEPPDAKGVPGINITYGRVILTAAGKVGMKVRLRFGDKQGVLTFGDGASEAAIEVRPFHPPGTDPEKTPSQPVVDLYAQSGQIRWTMVAGTDGNPLQAPARVAVIAAPGDTSDVKDSPKWLKAEQVSDIDRRASKIMYKTLDAENSLQRLRELATHRNIENRALAIRSLAHLGEFEDLIASLRDEDQKSMWQLYFESAQAALARNSDMAGKLRLTWEKQRSDKAGELNRLLWGYSKTDLENGEAVKLVEDLNVDDLDFRVLSFLNLKAITNITLLYRPEATAAARRQSVITWQSRLKDGTIVPKGDGGIVPKGAVRGPST